MTTAERAHAATKRVTYKPNSGFRVLVKAGLVFVQHYQRIPCSKTGEVCVQKGRKFVISDHATDGEILRTLFLAVKLFEEHEINEQFCVDGQRFLNPHPEGARPDNRKVTEYEQFAARARRRCGGCNSYNIASDPYGDACRDCGGRP